jgi:hypothetical protein
MKTLLFIAIATLLPVQVASAQGYEDYDDPIDEESEEAREATRKKKTQVVREVVKGFYAKANVGTSIYLGNFRIATSAGTTTTIGVGSEFIDQEKFSMAWELAFNQGVHNGLSYELQAKPRPGEPPGPGCQFAGGPHPCHQGDLRTYTLLASMEASSYPSRRIGVGARLGAGILISPLLIDKTAYETEVVPEFGGDPGFHDGVKPLFLFGPTFEYYSKLSHFSVGIDADIFYGIGWDLGVNATGYFKYTF